MIVKVPIAITELYTSILDIVYYITYMIMARAYILSLYTMVSIMPKSSICHVSTSIKKSSNSMDSDEWSSDDSSASNMRCTYVERDLIFTSATLILSSEDEAEVTSIDLMPIISYLVVKDGGYMLLKQIIDLYPTASLMYLSYYNLDTYIPIYKAIDVHQRSNIRSLVKCSFGRLVL